MDRILITVAGYTRLEAEIKRLKTVDRPAVIQAIATAREHGDLKENAEYHAAREQQSFIEGRLRELESTLSFAEAIDVVTLAGDTIKFGATVTLVDEETEEEVTYQIVSEYEANLEKRLISLNAPIARAMIGKYVGDSIEVFTPKGEKYYEILMITFV